MMSLYSVDNNLFASEAVRVIGDVYFALFALGSLWTLLQIERIAFY